MTEMQDVGNTVAANWEKSLGVFHRLLDVAKPSAVYGEPVQAGDYTLITASEVSMGVGIGQGFGSGSDTQTRPGEETPHVAGGGGGGGGGGGWSRPVAVISVGPGGVRVEPIVDVTKVALAFFTMMGSMIFMLRRMQKGAK